MYQFENKNNLYNLLKMSVYPMYQFFFNNVQKKKQAALIYTRGVRGTKKVVQLVQGKKRPKKC